MPEGNSINIIQVQPGSWRFIHQLQLLFNDVFEIENPQIPSHSYFESLLKREDYFVLVALESEKVVGGITSYLLQTSHSEIGVLYIYDLAVSVSYQRQGIGRMLLQRLIQHANNIGIKEVYVQADREDSHALDFYKACGGNDLDAIQFSFYLKPN